MSKAATSGILSAVVVLAWTGVYLSRHPRSPLDEPTDQAGNDLAEDDYDIVFYPMDEAIDTTSNDTSSYILNGTDVMVINTTDFSNETDIEKREFIKEVGARKIGNNTKFIKGF